MAKVQSPQLGYNTNVRHKGKLFHIQTEDSGVNRPHIITHLFADGGRILKSVKSTYADALNEPDLVTYVRRRMQEQHKAMFVALRDGQYDAMVEFDVAPPPTATAALDDAAPATVPPPEPEAPRNTAPPAEVVAARSLAPPPRSSLTPTVGTRITGAMAAPLPGRSPSSATPVGGSRTTGRTSLRSTGAREAPAVPGSLIPPRLPAVEEPPKNPPVFSNSMRYTAPRMVAPSILPPARERAVSSDAFVLERTLDELILAMLSDELSV